MQETWVPSLSWEDPPGGGNGTPPSSILAWEIPGTEEPDGLYGPGGCKRITDDLTIDQSIETLSLRVMYPKPVQFN